LNFAVESFGCSIACAFEKEIENELLMVAYHFDGRFKFLHFSSAGVPLVKAINPVLRGDEVETADLNRMPALNPCILQKAHLQPLCLPASIVPAI
jgi:hypothetical protein